MAEFGITKIMDGIFIADDSLAQDLDFLESNKVSHVIIWSSQDNPVNLSGTSIKVLKYHKSDSGALLPQQTSFQQIMQFIEEARQQFLCCLICSDTQSQAAMLLSSYIMRKFLWDLRSAFDFINFRFDIFNPRVQIVEQLQEYQLHLQSIYKQSSKSAHKSALKSIQFTYSFLSSFVAQDLQEKLLLNTIKNMVMQSQKVQEPKKNYSKRRKRVQWFDKLRPMSSLTSFNSKYTVYNRSSSLKPKNKFAQKQIVKTSEIIFKEQIKPKILKRNSDMVNSGDFFMDDLEFQSLKELSRTKMYESRSKVSLRKRTTLKVIKQEKTPKQNIQSLVTKAKKKNQFQLKGIDSKNFLKNLKYMSASKLGPAGLNA